MPTKFVQQYSAQNYTKDLPEAITGRYDFICFDRDLISGADETTEIRNLLGKECYTNSFFREPGAGIYCFMPSSRGDGYITLVYKSPAEINGRMRIQYFDDGYTYTFAYADAPENKFNSLDDLLVDLAQTIQVESRIINRLLVLKNILSFGNDDQKLDLNEEKLAKEYIVARKTWDYHYSFLPDNFNKFIKDANFKYGDKIFLGNGKAGKTLIKMQESRGAVKEAEFPNRLFRYYAVLQQQVTAKEEKDKNMKAIIKQLEKSTSFYEDVLAMLKALESGAVPKPEEKPTYTSRKNSM